MYDRKNKAMTSYRNTHVQVWFFLVRAVRGVTVMVEDPPIPFSPFSLADCTMLSHFSFNDFVAIAFPDIAGDLDIQI